jgi:hypothetical protein
MRKTAYILTLVGLGALVLGGCDADSPDFKVCESTYALCTTAACTPIPGEDDTVSCACDVKTGYSAGEESCTGEVQTSEGKQISSRYYPIKSYAVCDNDRAWAWCLDKPCIVDESDPTKASCACTVTKNQGPYLVVTDTYTDTTCTTNMWSSATVAGTTQLTNFLKTNKNLKPFDIKVLNPQK